MFGLALQPGWQVHPLVLVAHQIPFTLKEFKLHVFACVRLRFHICTRMHTLMGMSHSMLLAVRAQFMMWGLGMEFRWSGLMTSVLTHKPSYQPLMRAIQRDKEVFLVHLVHE